MRASASFSTCLSGMPLKSNTAVPLSLRTCTWTGTPLGKRLVTASRSCSASARASRGKGLLEAGLRLRRMALRSCSTVHAEKGMSVTSPFSPGTSMTVPPGSSWFARISAASR